MRARAFYQRGFALSFIRTAYIGLSVYMNPSIFKTITDMEFQIDMSGEVLGIMAAGDYFVYRKNDQDIQ